MDSLFVRNFFELLDSALGLLAIIISLITAFGVAWATFYFNRRLEEFKTRFNKLHEKRMEVIAELYRRIVRAEQAMRTFVTVMPPESGENLKLPEKGKLVYKAIDELWDFFTENRIYFNEGICNKLSTLENEIFEACLFFEYSMVNYLKADASEEEKIKKLENVLAKVRDSSKRILPSIKKEIEDEFRNLIGVKGVI